VHAGISFRLMTTGYRWRTLKEPAW